MASSLALLFFLSLIVFLLIFILPGSVTDAMFSRPEAVSESVKKQIEINLGLDKNVFLQYFSWIFAFLQGDFGLSLISGESISAIIGKRLPNTVALSLASFFFISLFSLILGFICAIYKNKFIDIFINVTTFLLACLPHFWVGLAFILVFSLILGLFPSSGVNEISQSGISLKHLFLPILSVVLPHLGLNIKFIKDTFLESLSKDFIQASYARGLEKSRIYLLAFQDALPVIVQYLGTLMGGIFAGSYVVESVFSYPGIGELAISSVVSKDYPVVISVVLLSAVFVKLSKLVAQIIPIMLDKRNLCKFINFS